MFPASKLGNINTFASPFNGLVGAFEAATSGMIAASNCNSPSAIKFGSFSFNKFVASITYYYFSKNDSLLKAEFCEVVLRLF